MIHKEFVTPPADSVKRNNRILKNVIEKLIEAMQHDRRFDAYFIDVFYGGSFYDGLKVGLPDEFDLDFLFNIPGCILRNGNLPGYVKIKLNGRDIDEDNERFIDAHNYLLPSLFRNWFKSVVSKAMSRFHFNGRRNHIFDVIVHENGPAQNLELRFLQRGFVINIDLVPCIYFEGEYWPRFIRQNPVESIPDYFAVPKSPKSMQFTNNNSIYARHWRLSFQQQERHILHDNNRLKPTLKLLKLLRDKWEHHEIASYYLKTFVLNLTDKYTNEFWDQSWSNVFMIVLREYSYALRKSTITYYWDNRYNFLEYVGPARLKSIANKINRIKGKLKNADDIDAIERCFNIY